MIGRELSRFRITAKLGEGGMGEVYRAEDTTLGREVAIKVLPEAFVADGERLARFEREAKVLASLEHPNIAAIYEVGEAEGVHYLAMQLAPGDDLAAVLDQGTPALEATLSIALQIAQALEAAHARGVVHRDLKPANVKVARDGSGGVTAKVLDFGLAKAWDDGGDQDSSLSMSPTLTAQMTQAGVILGTAGYMAPEQARGLAADARADIWSFGVVLWEMLSGRRLFAADTVSDTLARVLTFEPEKDNLEMDLPAPIRRLLRRCLEPDTGQRLQAIGEARIVLERFLANPEAEPVATGGEADPQTHRQSAAARWGSLVAAMVVGVVAATLAGRSLAPDPPPPRVRKFEITSTEFRTGLSSSPSISPDGRAILIPGNQLLVRSLDQLEMRALDGSDGAGFGIWSPDSQHIAFQAEDRMLYRTDLARGGRRPIARVPGDMYLLAGTWLEDDSLLLAVWRGDVYRVSASGGEPEIFFELEDTEIDVHRLLALPDGKGVAASIHTDGPWPLVVVRDGERRQIGEEMSPAGFTADGDLLYRTRDDALWAAPFDLETLEFTGEPLLVASGTAVPSLSNDGTLIYGAAFDDLPSTIARVDRQGNILEVFGDAQEGLEGPRLSPDGRYITAEFEAPGSRVNNIWVLDLERGVWSRLTTDPTDQGHPAWSADGERVYFRDGPHVSMIRSDGVGGKQVLFPGRDPEPTSDGSRLIFRHEATLHSVALDNEGMPDGEPERVSGTPEGEALPGVVSPDGRYIAYASQETEGVEVFLTEFPESKSRWQVSRDGGTTPSWRPDGGAVYYREDGALYEVTLEVEGETPRLGTPVELFSGRDYNGRIFMGVSPLEDGQTFLVVSDVGEGGTASPRLIVIENALAELRR